MKARSAAEFSLRPWLVASVAVHALVAVVATHHGPGATPETTAPKPSATPVGETFDVTEGDDTAEGADETDGIDIDTQSGPAGEGEARRPAHARSRRRSPTGPAGSSSASAAAPPRVFGAEGDRAAVDLATSFTRTFPQVASADPSWSRMPLGSAGSLDVVVEIDDQGNVTSAEVHGGSGALRAGAERTLQLLRHRVFVAHARATTLHVVGNVASDTVHDGLHGDVFAVGGSFIGGEGDAFFALSIGRRIDAHVTER